jgi:Ricin-type beta-trefoil lectin domain-like/Metallo-peptidase family M12B Reprolysin-like
MALLQTANILRLIITINHSFTEVNVMQIVKKIITLCVVPLCIFTSNIAHAVTADLLVLYNTASKNKLNGNPEAAVKGWVTQMNNTYIDSRVDIQLRLVGVVFREVGNSDMGPVLSTLRTDSNVANLRNQYGADLVSQLAEGQYCGLAYQSLDAAYAFSVVAPGCGSAALIHELGHNMGLAHARRQGDTGGAVYRYGIGHTVDNLFATIMAYGYTNTPEINRFSDPDSTCRGQPCGVREGQSNEANSRLALNNSKNTIAGWKQATTTGGNTPPSGQVILRARHSNSCVDVNNSQNANGANIQQWGCNNQANQKWQFNSKGGGWYEIKSALGRCMDVAGPSTANGANIHTWDCSNGTNQQFKLTATDGGYYTLTARHSNSCVDVSGPSTANGANVHQWGCYNGTNQQFKFN